MTWLPICGHDLQTFEGLLALVQWTELGQVVVDVLQMSRQLALVLELCISTASANALQVSSGEHVATFDRLRSSLLFRLLRAISFAVIDVACDVFWWGVHSFVMSGHLHSKSAGELAAFADAGEQSLGVVHAVVGHQRLGRVKLVWTSIARPHYQLKMAELQVLRPLLPGNDFDNRLSDQQKRKITYLSL